MSDIKVRTQDARDRFEAAITAAISGDPGNLGKTIGDSLRALADAVRDITDLLMELADDVDRDRPST